MLPQLDLAFFPSQIFWLFVCFGILFLYINYYFFPRMQKMFEKREAKILSENKILEYNLKEIQLLKDNHTKMLSDAKQESAERINQAEESTQHFIETKKIEIDANFIKKFEEMKHQLEEELNNFHANIEEEVLKSSYEIIKKIEGKEVSFKELKKINENS